MSLHAIAVRLKPPVGYLGSSSTYACTNPAHHPTDVLERAYHRECFTPGSLDSSWSCECPNCLQDSAWLFIETGNVFYEHDAQQPDDDEEDEDDQYGICSLCFDGSHHYDFMTEALANARTAQEPPWSTASPSSAPVAPAPSS